MKGTFPAQSLAPSGIPWQLAKSLIGVKKRHCDNPGDEKTEGGVGRGE